jgi:hypothetical protein
MKPSKEESAMRTAAMAVTAENGPGDGHCRACFTGPDRLNYCTKLQGCLKSRQPTRGQWD